MTEAMIRNKPGMASVKDMPVLQDGPPPGGFPPVRYARRIPTKGPSAIAIFLATFTAFSWGMYQVGQGNKVRRYISFTGIVTFSIGGWEIIKTVFVAFELYTSIGQDPLLCPEIASCNSMRTYYTMLSRLLAKRR